MIQPPCELDATLLDTTLLDIAFNGCDDASSNDGKIKCTSEHTTAVSTVIEHQVELLRSEVHCQRELILKLQQQLRSVLSVLGITEQAIQLTVINESTTLANLIRLSSWPVATG